MDPPAVGDAELVALAVCEPEPVGGAGLSEEPPAQPAASSPTRERAREAVRRGRVEGVEREVTRRR